MDTDKVEQYIVEMKRAEFNKEEAKYWCGLISDISFRFFCFYLSRVVDRKDHNPRLEI